jgi:hypothetical protein
MWIMLAQLFVKTIKLAGQRIRPMIAVVAITVTELLSRNQLRNQLLIKNSTVTVNQAVKKLPIQAVYPNGSNISIVD